MIAGGEPEAKGSVTAIIPTYNRAAYLPEAITSVLAQGAVIGHVVVCDDGSTDQTAEIVESFAVKSSGAKISYIFQKNAGKSAALNRAMEFVTSPYIWIVDDDDVAIEQAIPQLVAALEGSPEAALAYGKFAIFRDTRTGRVITPVEDKTLGEGDAFIANLRSHRLLQEACLFRTLMLADVGPHDILLNRSVDWDYTLRVTSKFPSVYVPHLIFMQRQHDGQRGPASDRFAASEQFEKWAVYDKIVLEKALRDIPVERFSLAPDAEHARMLLSARLVRAASAYRKAMWEEGRAELEEMVRLANAAPAFKLSATEKAFLSEQFGTQSPLLTPGLPVNELFAPLRGLTNRTMLAEIRSPIAKAFLRLALRSVRRSDMQSAKAGFAMFRDIARLRG